MKHLPAAHNTPEARAARNREWIEMKEEQRMSEEQLLRTHANEFQTKTGYGLANVYGAIQQGELAEARALLNEQMAINYMADNGYTK